MGTHCSSELRRGHRNITMKLLLLTVFAAVALAEEVAEVEEVAKSAVVPLAYPYAYNQLHWPAVYGIGYSSQCWGCRGKRSADPAPGVSPPFPGNIEMEDINYGKTQIIMDFCPMVMGSHFIMVFLHSLCLNSVLESMMIKLLVWLPIQKQMPPPGLK